MTVTQTVALDFFEFGHVSRKQIKCEGFFRATVTGPGDASAGQHEFVFQEPADILLPYRSLLVRTLVVQQTGDGTGGQPGWLRVYGKAQGDYEQTVERMLSYAQVGAEGDNFFVCQLSGHDLGRSMRDHGWYVPAMGTGTPRQFAVVVELVNRGATITSSAYIYGWYKTHYMR